MHDLRLSTTIYEKSRARTYNTAYSQEPNNNRKGVSELRGIGSLDTVHYNSLKKFKTNI